MPKGETGFEKVIDQLQAVYDRPKRPKVSDPLGLILLENVAYLLSDERRETAFKALKGQLPPDCSSLVRAHHLLRQHGQEICRRSDSGCLSCPLASRCHFYQDGISRTMV